MEKHFIVAADLKMCNILLVLMSHGTVILAHGVIFLKDVSKIKVQIEPLETWKNFFGSFMTLVIQNRMQNLMEMRYIHGS